MSLSDGSPMMTMPVAPANNYGGGMGMWGDSWIWIIVLFLFGWGRNGFGNGNGGGVMDGYVLTSDFASVERKLDSIANGICDSTFALNNSINTGFAGVQNTLTQGFAGVNTGMVTQGYESRLATQGLSAQLASCCCDIREGISGVNYNLATQACDTRNTVQNATRDIIDNQNANSRAVLDYLQNSRMRDLEAENASLKLAASQAAQNNYLVNTLRPPASPAYIVQNPYCCNQQYMGCGCGCGAA